MLNRRQIITGLGASLFFAPAIVRAASIWIPPRRVERIVVPYLWGGKLTVAERELIEPPSIFRVVQPGEPFQGYLYSDELSDILRAAVQPYSMFRQLTDAMAEEPIDANWDTEGADQADPH